MRMPNASSINVSELENIEEILDYDRAVAKEDRRNSLPWFHKTSLSSLVAREERKVVGRNIENPSKENSAIIFRLCVFTKSRVWNQLSGK